MENKKNKKGFTLAELLIVVAIIAVLVAIAIPVFNAQLERSREATDLANLRAAYAEVMVAAIEDETSAPSQTVNLHQQQADWQTNTAEATLIELCGSDSNVTGSPAGGGTATVSWVAGSGSEEGHCTIAF